MFVRKHLRFFLALCFDDDSMLCAVSFPIFLQIALY